MFRCSYNAKLLPVLITSPHLQNYYSVQTLSTIAPQDLNKMPTLDDIYEVAKELNGVGNDSNSCKYVLLEFSQVGFLSNIYLDLPFQSMAKHGLRAFLRLYSTIIK